MDLTLNLVLPDGQTTQLKGTALPRFDRPTTPQGVELTLVPEDDARLKAAVSRLRRAETAHCALGDIQLGWNMEEGFVASPPVPDLAVKAFALEARPFFLNDDPLFFPALVKLRSFAQAPEVARGFRSHTKRWKASAFGGVMGVQIGAHALDIDTVVCAWFNSDLFHTVPQDPTNLSLEGLVKMVGGEDQARALLASHLVACLSVANDFIVDVCAISSDFRSWMLTTNTKPTSP